MILHSGTEQCPEGAYFNLSTWEFIQLREETPFLPGSKDTKYIKVPSVLVMLTSPLAGLALILFLPFIGIVGIIALVGYKIWLNTLGRRKHHKAAKTPPSGQSHPDRQEKTHGGGGDGRNNNEFQELVEQMAKRKPGGDK